MTDPTRATPEKISFSDETNQAELDNLLRLSDGTQIDLSDRQQVIAALRQREDRLRIALESAQIGAWDCDLTTGDLIWDNQCKRLWGLASDAAINYDVFLAGLHPEDRDRIHETLQYIFTAQSSGTCDLEFRTVGIQDGIERWIVSKGQVYFTPTGEPVRFIGTVLDITEVKRREVERQQAKTQLSDRQERLQAALAASETGTFRWNIRTDELDWDENLDRLFGLPPGQTARSLEAFIQLVHPDDRQGVIDRCQCCASEGADFEMDFRVIHPDGSIRWLLDKGKTFFDRDGKPAYMTGACVDITDRKQVESELRQKNAILNLINDSTPTLIFIKDREGRIIFANSATLKILGRPASEVIGYRDNQIYPEFSRAIMDNDRRIMETGNTETVEECPDGVRTFLSVKVPYRDETGAVIGLIGIASDISDRVRLQSELRESEARYRALAEAIPQLVWVTTPDGQNEFVNQQFCDFVGLDRTQLLNLDWLSILHPDDRDRTRERWLASVNSGDFYEIEYRFRCFDGTYRWFLGQGVPFRNELGQIIKWFGTCTDIDAQKQLEASRLRAIEQEKAAREASDRANRIKDEFLAVLSHELRSPLNPILGWSRMLKTGRLDAAKTQEAIAIIERNAQLQAQLIEDLLDISRILQGKLTLNREPVNLEFVILAALETVRLAAEVKEIAIVTELEPQAVQVLGDAGRLQQIVWNLLTNAVKFTPSGGRITVRLTRTDTQAQLQVIDTGEGIAPEFLPYVFERFRQADSSTTRKFGGLGLGLAIVRQLIELHGGTISAESKGQGQGAAFTVLLPVFAETNRQLSEMPDSAASVRAQDAPLSGSRILVVDDELDSREFVAFVLEESGAIVTQAASAVQALELLSRTHFDALISDIGMPEMNGYTLIQQIRARSLEQRGQIPALALTAYAGEINAQKALQAGFTHHLAKPIDPDELIAVVTQLTQASYRAMRD